MIIGQGFGREFSLHWFILKKIRFQKKCVWGEENVSKIISKVDFGWSPFGLSQ